MIRRVVSALLISNIWIPILFTAAQADPIRVAEVVGGRNNRSVQGIPHSYLEGIRRKILKHYIFIKDCGGPLLSLVVSKEGEVSNLRIEQSRGCDESYDMAVKAIRASEPLGQIPYPCDAVKIIIDFRQIEKRMPRDSS